VRSMLGGLVYAGAMDRCLFYDPPLNQAEDLYEGQPRSKAKQHAWADGEERFRQTVVLLALLG